MKSFIAKRENYIFNIEGENYCIIQKSPNCIGGYCHQHMDRENWSFVDIFINSVVLPNGEVNNGYEIAKDLRCKSDGLNKYLETQILPELDDNTLNEITVSYKKDVEIKANSLEEALEKITSKVFTFNSLEKSFSVKSEPLGRTEKDNELLEQLKEKGWKMYDDYRLHYDTEYAIIEVFFEDHVVPSSIAEIVAYIKNAYTKLYSFWQIEVPGIKYYELVSNLNKIISKVDEQAKPVYELVEYLKLNGFDNFYQQGTRKTITCGDLEFTFFCGPKKGLSRYELILTENQSRTEIYKKTLSINELIKYDFQKDIDEYQNKQILERGAKKYLKNIKCADFSFDKEATAKCHEYGWNCKNTWINRYLKNNTILVSAYTKIDGKKVTLDKEMDNLVFYNNKTYTSWPGNTFGRLSENIDLSGMTLNDFLEQTNTYINQIETLVNEHESKLKQLKEFLNSLGFERNVFHRRHENGFIFNYTIKKWDNGDFSIKNDNWENWKISITSDCPQLGSYNSSFDITLNELKTFDFNKYEKEIIEEKSKTSNLIANRICKRAMSNKK